eukprot:365252-Chlamydomonas_euryale.AAC.35
MREALPDSEVHDAFTGTQLSGSHQSSITRQMVWRCGSSLPCNGRKVAVYARHPCINRTDDAALSMPECSANIYRTAVQRLREAATQTNVRSRMIPYGHVKFMPFITGCYVNRNR